MSDKGPSGGARMYKIIQGRIFLFVFNKKLRHSEKSIMR